MGGEGRGGEVRGGEGRGWEGMGGEGWEGRGGGRGGEGGERTKGMSYKLQQDMCLHQCPPHTQPCNTHTITEQVVVSLAS